MRRYAYRLRNQHYGSDRLGNCEVCHKQVNSVYLMSKMVAYNHGTTCDQYSSVSTTFGHKSCLCAKMV